MIKKLKSVFRSWFRKKIRVVFICHRPAVWGSLDNLFNEFRLRPEFAVTIVAVPNKVQDPSLGFNHENYQTEGAEAFFSNFPCNVVNGYNYESGEWFDIKKLKPDYVFFQQPYDVFRPEELKSRRVSKFSKICYIHYACNFIGGGVFEETYPADFFRNVNFIFSQGNYDQEMIRNYLESKNISAVPVVTGFPRYDNTSNWSSRASSWKRINDCSAGKKFLWTPRWTTNEGTCTFFDYKDTLLTYFQRQENKKAFLLFRPHPQSFQEWAATGEMNVCEQKKFRDTISRSSNIAIDNCADYFGTIAESDALISDASSFIADFFLSGKPIIYCHKKDRFNDFSRKLSEGFYWARSPDELIYYIEQIQLGIDPLKSKREKLIKELFYFNNERASVTIANFLINNFYHEKYKN